MNDWRVCALGELIEIKHGFAFRGEHFVEEDTGQILVTPGNFAIGGGFKQDKPKWYRKDVSFPREFVLSTGDLIIVMTDLSRHADILGYGAIVPDDGVTYLHNQRIGLVRVLNPEETDLNFLHYLTRSEDYRRQVVAGASGTTVHHTSPGRIKNTRVVLPPLPIQLRIAEILGRLDDKIEVNRRINRTLERMAQALYKHWFVDFGPFQDGEFVESEVGLVPRGWEVKALADVVDLLSGGTPKTSVTEYWDGDIDWVSAKDVASGAPFIMATERKITRKGVDSSATKILPAFTTVITARGTVGQCGLLPWGMAMNQTNYGLRGKGGLGNFTTYLIVRDAVDRLRQHAYGTVFDTITRKTFEAIQVALPPDSILIEFEAIIDPWFRVMLVNQRQNAELARTRDYLLPRLLAGEVEV